MQSKSCTVLLVLLLVMHAHGWWDENCAEGGQCPNMIKSYESLIKGKGCHSFYSTGKCSRICTYSLKSLINRHMWSKCAERCKWSKAVTEGASSWLRMCLARPAADVLKPEGEVNSIVTDHSKKSEKSAGTKRVSIDGVHRGANMLRQALYFLLFGLLIGSLAAITMTPKWRRVAMKVIMPITSRIRRLVRGRGSRSNMGRAPLDIGPNRVELRNLQRGARRHLKSMRSALD